MPYYPNRLSSELAYAIGLTLGCGTASYVVNLGLSPGSPPVSVMKAPLLPMESQ